MIIGFVAGLRSRSRESGDFWGKESGVGKPRESESGVGNFENLSQQKSGVGFFFG